MDIFGNLDDNDDDDDMNNNLSNNQIINDDHFNFNKLANKMKGKYSLKKTLD